MQLFTDAAKTHLTADISDSDTSFTLIDASAFPIATAGSGSIDDGDWFKVVIDDKEQIEIVYVRTRSGDTFSNVLRGQEGTTARAWTAGTVVGLRLTAEDARRFNREAVVVVDQGDDPDCPRPDAQVVLWTGTATPNNAAEGDMRWNEL